MYSLVMIPRHLAGALIRAVAQYPVVTLTGPRQAGKTTLLRAVFPHHRYVSLEVPDERRFAVEDPRGFLARFAGPAILDEAQHVPDLFSYIQVLVDERGGVGHFILSGSQNFLLMRQVTQSLAGRAYIAHLLPFSVAELRSLPPRDAHQPLALAPEIPTDPPTVGEWPELALTGFYPPVHDRGLQSFEWSSQYFQTYLQRDVRSLTQVGDLEAFRRFVLLCAGRIGQLLNLSSLGNDCGVSHETARRWLSVLEASFVVFRLPPHHQRFNKRLTKSPKLYFVDTGLVCYLLQIRNADELAIHAMRGPVFENLVIADLMKRCFHAGIEPRLAFWRDHRGNEIDLVVNTPDGPVPVEIKSGATVASSFFKGLRYWRKIVPNPRPGMLVYGGGESYFREDTVVLSWRHWQ